ncbi:MAG: DUF6668 family protein [Dermatophilaceae bacterium]
MAGEGWRAWLPSTVSSPDEPESVDSSAELDQPTGPVTPQPHVPMPKNTLPVRRVQSLAALWVVGAHSASGETTLADLDEGWQAAGHTWPELPSGAPAACVVVARTNVRGLLAAQAALTQWAASGAGASARLLGLVLMADAPGKLPTPIRDLAKVVGGGAPRVWVVPWVEAWRLADPMTERVPRPVSKLVSTLRSLSASAVADADPSRSEEHS